MDGEQPLPTDYFRVPRLWAVRKVLVELLVSRSARMLAAIRCRTVVEVTASMTSHGRSGWVTTRCNSGDEWTVVLDPQDPAGTVEGPFGDERGDALLSRSREIARP